MKNHALVLVRDPDEFEKRLNALSLPDLTISVSRSKEEAISLAPNVNIILGVPAMARSIIPLAQKLQWFQSEFAGVDALIDSQLPNHYLLTNVKDTYGEIMAEYVFAYVLLFEKKVLDFIEHQKNAHWNTQLSSTLSDTTLCVLGTGSIGKVIAQAAKTFGMKTLGLNTNGHAEEYFDHCYGFSDLSTCLSKGDYIVSVLPSTKETRGIMNGKTFSFMKESAVFINIGRGDAVVEDDLVRVLNDQKIRAAVLDVTCTEPLPKESPLWSAENIFITPHVSGYCVTDRIFKIFSDNYMRFLEGRPLEYQVDFQKGY